MRVIRFSKVSIATGRVVLVAMALALVFGMLVGALPEGGAAQPSG